VADIGQSLLDAIADLKAVVERRFAAMDQRFASVDERLASMDRRLAGVDERFTSVDGQFTTMDERLAAIDERLTALAPIRAQLDGLPLINRAVTVVQQDVRALRAAFNDFALTNPTSG
jgi:hypothetical protein